MPLMSFQTSENGCCCLDIRPYWAFWKLCGIVERTLDPVLVYHQLTWSKNKSLNFCVLVSASEKGDFSSYVLSTYSQWNNFKYAHHPGLAFFFNSLFGTLYSWSCLWSAYCCAKAFVKSQSSFNWGLILLAMTSLIMDLAVQPCRDLAEPQQLYY